MTIRNLITAPPALPLVAPSILSADFADLGAECRAVLEAGADLLHLDVMDGHFAPNLTIGPALCRSLRKTLPNAFLDVHLMVTDPGEYVEPFAEAGADHVTFHVEACDDPPGLAETIRGHGMTAGLAIKPPTNADRMIPYLAAFDLALVMSVNPGFSGQSFIESVLGIVRSVSESLRDDQRLQMDGGVNSQMATRCRDAGCDLLVAGSAIFGAADYVAAVSAVRGPSAVPTGAATESRTPPGP